MAYKKLSKLQMSNNAHHKLRRRYTDCPGFKGDLFYAYHDEVLKRQKNKILPKKQRRFLFVQLSHKFKGSHPRRSYNNMNPNAWYNVFYSKPDYKISSKKGSFKFTKKRNNDDGLPF